MIKLNYLIGATLKLQIKMGKIHLLNKPGYIVMTLEIMKLLNFFLLGLNYIRRLLH